eukprot:TRINITY_DN723_c0_g1_i2.p1 TRINITY_DN723_c0_g1~~TRINITY_DN723_c0_g1_i2.p1  ORF type:complete len:530 (-),score=165.24 TRINITY_DN723_c0_g1_i2:1461-2849(-)
MEEEGEDDAVGRTDGLEFEDPYEDVYDDDEEVVQVEEGEGEGEMDVAEERPTRIWRRGVDPIGKDEELDYDPSAYDTFHRMSPEWPCLSFDFLSDTLGMGRTKYPMTVYMVTGTQADTAAANTLTLMKLSGLVKTKENEDPDADSDDEEDDMDDEDPVLDMRSIPHTSGGVNRIRSMLQNPGIIASWSDIGKVHLFNLRTQLQSLDGPIVAPPPKTVIPFWNVSSHSVEGYGLAWSPCAPGLLASGDGNGLLAITQVSDARASIVGAARKSHLDSIEDIQWSPEDPNTLATSSVDRSIAMWDLRKPGASAAHHCMNAHDSDINVIAWNPTAPFILASGADDGTIRVWDIRYLGDNTMFTSHVQYHEQAITSIEWHPTEASVLAASSEDETVTIWDFSVEKDAEAMQEEAQNALQDEEGIPDQLMFVHQGQSHIKEIHFHRQIPGLIGSTAYDGFNIFKTFNV